MDRKGHRDSTEGAKTTLFFFRRRWLAKPFKLPLMPDLIVERTRKSALFENSGLDYAGPGQVLGKEKRVEKRWIVIFTCLVTRAAHLECVCSQSTSDFLRAFKKFRARREMPGMLLSDNAEQFVIAARCVTFKWSFVIPFNPWKGGIYERFVGLVKTCFRDRKTSDFCQKRSSRN